MSGGAALIGYTGFVGSNLDRQHRFSARFDSRTISESAGQGYDLVVCAAAPGSMLEANRLPAADEQRIERLIDSLRRLRAQRFVLISTIAVLADFGGGQDEQAAAFSTATPYARHRRALELRCAELFDDCRVIRLPALFGTGLSKNLVFDLLNPMPSFLTEPAIAELHDRLDPRLADALRSWYRLRDDLQMYELDRAGLDRSGTRAAFDAAVVALGLSSRRFTNPRSTFQFYPLDRLWSDVTLASDAGVRTLHMATEAVEARTVAAAIGAEMPDSNAPLHTEDMRTRHAALWGRQGGYLMSAADVLARLAQFAARYSRAS